MQRRVNVSPNRYRSASKYSAAPAGFTRDVAVRVSPILSPGRHMTWVDGADPNRRHKGLSISFDPIEARWLDTVVDLLRQEGFPKVSRSDIVRLSVLGLRESLMGRTRSEIVTYCVQREADRLVASLDDSSPRLPFT